MYWELPCVSIAIYYKHFVLYVYRVLLPENKRVVNYHSTLRILDSWCLEVGMTATRQRNNPVPSRGENTRLHT